MKKIYILVILFLDPEWTKVILIIFTAEDDQILGYISKEIDCGLA
jgi:hypothetical protein